MRKKTLLIFILSFFLSTGAFASGYLTPLGTGVEIAKYQILGNGGMVVWLSEPIPQNPDSCNQTSKLFIKGDLPQFNAMISSIMAAHAQGKKVGFWSNGCSTNYFWGGSITFPAVRDLWVN